MAQAEQLIQAYRLGFNISLIITIFAVISAGFIFFKFDIRTIFSIQTGRAAQQTIEKMATENAKTGRLRPEIDNFTTDGFTTEDGRKTAPQVPPPTTPLGPSAAQTSLLAGGAPAPEPVSQPLAAPAAAPGFVFRMTENVMLVHTTELI